MVSSVAEVEGETSSSSLTTAVETHDAQQKEEARGVLLELSEELSQAGQDFSSFCIFVSHLQRYITTYL